MMDKNQQACWVLQQELVFKQQTWAFKQEKSMLKPG